MNWHDHCSSTLMISFCCCMLWTNLACCLVITGKSLCDADMRSHQAVSQRHQAEGLHHRDHGGLLRLPGHCWRSGRGRRHGLHLRGAVWHPGPAGQRRSLPTAKWRCETLYIYLVKLFNNATFRSWSSGCVEAAQITREHCSVFHQVIAASVWRFQECAGDPDYSSAYEAKY